MYFLIKNLEYEEPGERFIIIDLIHILVEQLPEHTLHYYMDVLYYSLILRLAKEDSDHNHQGIQQTLITLKNRMKKEKLTFFKNVALEWIEDKKL